MASAYQNIQTILLFTLITYNDVKKEVSISDVDLKIII